MGAALIGVPLLLGAAVGVAVAAAAAALAARVPSLDRDVAAAVVVTPLLGLGILLALSPDTPAGLSGLLFGDVLGATDGEIVAAGALARGARRGARRCSTAGWRRSASTARGAAALGVRPARRRPRRCWRCWRGALLVSVQALGNLLVVGLLIAPAATARLVTRRLPAMMALSVAVARARLRRRPVPVLLRGHGGRRLDRRRARRHLRRRPRDLPSRLMADAEQTWVAQALARLSEAGFRNSAGRRAVVEALGAEHCAVSARDLEERLRRGRPRRGRGRRSTARSSSSTDLHLVTRVDVGDGTARYEPRHPGGEHHHHLICDTCGDVTPFEDEGLERAVRRLSQQVDFRVDEHDIVLHGACERCR